MTPWNDSDQNEAAFRQQKAQIDARYPSGHLVAFEHGRIIADASTYEALGEVLENISDDPRKVMVVIAGHDYPKHATILTVVVP